MKRLIYSLPLILLLSSCGERDTPLTDNGPRIINPWMNEEDRINTAQSSAEGEENSYLIPMIEIPENEHVVRVEDINLDTDTEEEQIILTLFTTDEGEERLKIYVADYDNDQIRYQRALEEIISPVRTDGISIYQQDITGNHLSELIITGFNAENNQTLDAFTINSRGSMLSYTRIVQLTANGTIEIQTADRSENYEGGVTTWESFPISTEETGSLESDNLDLVRTIYSWNRAASRYQPASVVQIPGSSIREENLKELYRGDVDDFKEFLQGPWHRVTDL
ncbi:MAG: pallilysin-related adhesin, partial [Spirochaetales bacterium]|nr:pallilysin-related adhesin [Spirochaetales bacterium]